MKTIREKLLGTTLKRVLVKLPEWNLKVYVQEMNAEQRDDYFSILTTALADKKQKKNISAKILLPSVVDENGERILTDDDLEKFAEISPQVIVKLTNTLLELSGLVPEFYESEKKRLKSQRNMSSFSNWLKNLVSRFQK